MDKEKTARDEIDKKEALQGTDVKEVAVREITVGEIADYINSLKGEFMLVIEFGGENGEGE